MQKIFFLSCFLIISSCDLPNEANKDCSGIQGGSAEIDDCEICNANAADNCYLPTVCPGDVTNDGTVNVIDLLSIVNLILNNGFFLLCAESRRRIALNVLKT